MPWSPELLAADATGVLTDAGWLAECAGDAAPAHLRTTDGVPTDAAGDQLGRTTMLYIADGALPRLALNSRVTVARRDPITGAAIGDGVVHVVLDVIVRGPFRVVSLSLPQTPASGASYA